MAWKLNSNGQIEVQNSQPVWVYEDGKESPFDAESALKQLGTLTSEAMAKKAKIRELEAKLTPFQSIENPDEFLSKAKQALETVQNMKDKAFIDAGEVEKLKKSVSESYETKIKEIEKALKSQIEEKEQIIKAKDTGIHQLLVKNAFMQSDFIRSKTVLPPDLAFDSFGKYFEVEEVEGQLQAVAKKNGERLYSRSKPGSYATPDEAIELLILERPDKDAILKANQSGSGSRQNVGTGNMDLMKLSPTERINAARRLQR